ncbi:MAG: MFS transporter [Candidatus Thorarchaeota archaeon]|nr:MFS transporter [Candidatus Thorarchaeota archaeon]
MAVEEETPVITEKEEKEPMRWLYVIVIGLGFFTTGVSWNVYNSYLPADFLPLFIGGAFQNTIIGLIMVLDNVAALFLQPYIGAKSDAERSRIGRRMPYILIGAPGAAVFFALIALGWAAFSFWLMFFFITVFNVFMAYYRAPVVALMPDVVPSEHRTKANGVINLMGGIGAIYAFAVASQIYKIDDPGLAALFGTTTTRIGPILTFLTTSIIMVISIIILYIVVKEPEVPPVDATKPKEVGIVGAMKQVSFANDKSTIGLLFAILFWFFGWNAMETWYTRYGREVLGFLTADASFQLTAFALSFVIFAVPAGFAANKLGRKRTILIGLIIMIASLGVLVVVTDYIMMMIIFVVTGLGWALVNVNSIVMVWEQLGKSRVGAGTGLYYMFSMTAAILGPLISGLIFDLTSLSFLFPVAIMFLIISFVIMMGVRTGEVGDELISEAAQ